MKTIILSTIFLTLSSFCLQAQTDIQVIKIKNADKSVSISAINHSDEEVKIVLKVVLEGMISERETEDAILLKPDDHTQITRLIPTAKKWHYQISYSVVSDTEAEQEYFHEPDVTIYTKNGQTKSTEIRLYLEKHNIPYREINVTFSKESEAKYEAMLKRRNIEERKAELPIVIIRGEVHMEIKNVKEFFAKYDLQ